MYLVFLFLPVLLLSVVQVVLRFSSRFPVVTGLSLLLYKVLSGLYSVKTVYCVVVPVSALPLLFPSRRAVRCPALLFPAPWLFAAETMLMNTTVVHRNTNSWFSGVQAVMKGQMPDPPFPRPCTLLRAFLYRLRVPSINPPLRWGR